MPNTARTIAIGDIHGHAKALAALLDRIQPRPDETVVTLGDYVDGGPDSRGVIDLLILLQTRCGLIPLLGNHEDMMLGARNCPVELGHWKYSGGEATLASYGAASQLGDVPPEHWRFIEQCGLFHATSSHFFIHASYDHWLPLERQDRKHLLWLSLNEEIPKPHDNGKIAIVGHTPQPGGRILDLPHLKCIDTGCGQGGLLTALDIETGRLWQVDEAGHQQ